MSPHGAWPGGTMTADGGNHRLSKLHVANTKGEELMAFKALDTSQNSRQQVPCLKNNGIVAIGRYYTRNRNNRKILTPDESRTLSAAGIKIWPVYQNRHRLRADFSAAKGKQEADDALDYAMNVIGQPAGSAIFCKSLLGDGLVELTWLSQSSGFNGSRDFKRSGRWNILQALGVKGFC